MCKRSPSVWTPDQWVGYRLTPFCRPSNERSPLSHRSYRYCVFVCATKDSNFRRSVNSKNPLAFQLRDCARACHIVAIRNEWYRTGTMTTPSIGKRIGFVIGAFIVYSLWKWLNLGGDTRSAPRSLEDSKVCFLVDKHFKRRTKGRKRRRKRRKMELDATIPV